MNVTPALRRIAFTVAAVLILGLQGLAAASPTADVVFSPDQSAVELKGFVRGAQEPISLTLGGLTGDGVISPDGKRVAFLDVSGDSVDLSVANLDGSHRKHLVASPGILSPSWSPDGRTIIFAAVNNSVSEATVSTIRTDGTHHEKVKMPRIKGHVAGLAFYKPHLSSDGKTVLATVILKRDGKVVPLILAVDRATASYRELVQGLDGTWSPNGRQLAFVREGADEKAHIWLANADGSKPRMLEIPRAFAPAWSPDGSLLYFNVISDEDVRVWSVRADGSGAAPVKGIPAGAVLSLSSKKLMLRFLEARK